MRTTLLLLLAVAVGAAAKPRLIVLTDIGGDPDDQQSLVRLMTYSNEFEIQALIASASGTPGELKRDLVQPNLIREVVHAYGQVRENLARRDPAYPTADSLLKVIFSGDRDRSLANIGNQSDTEGSNAIIKILDRSDPRPVNVTVWGGAHDLAQALWRVRQDRNTAEVDRFVAKLRVHSIGHQDETGPWIVENFPKLFFILSSVDEGDVLGKKQGKVDRRQSVYRGMYLGGDETLTSREWVEGHVKKGHGPLGALYPVKTWTAPNPHGTMKEGDTPSWFYFLENGLSDAAHPDWGSWGGRFKHSRDQYWVDAPEGRESVFRWREAFQNDFAARMDACAGNATRAPSAVLNGDRSMRVLEVAARVGRAVQLTAAGSVDPEGNHLSFRWYHYPQPGGQAAETAVDAKGDAATFTPPDTGEYHIVLEVRDGGNPELISYRRAVLRAVR